MCVCVCVCLGEELGDGVEVQRRYIDTKACSLGCCGVFENQLCKVHVQLMQVFLNSTVQHSIYIYILYIVVFLFIK